MAIFPDQLGAHVTGDPFTWTAHEASLYALTVGVSEDGSSRLPFTTGGGDGAGGQVLPTFAVILTMKSRSSPLHLVGDFPLSRIIHAGQEIETLTDIPMSGRATGRTEVSAIFDTGKHALIETTTLLQLEEASEPFARTTSRILVLGEGGFGGLAPSPQPAPPETPADGATTYATSQNQALWYRLNGDHNPLHYDHEVASRVGFDGPILHGLATFGIAAQSLLGEICGDETSRFGAFTARFSAPVYPGSTLETSWWQREDSVLFRTVANGKVVLDSGKLTLR